MKKLSHSFECISVGWNGNEGSVKIMWFSVSLILSQVSSGDWGIDQNSTDPDESIQQCLFHCLGGLLDTQSGLQEYQGPIS